MCGHGRPAGSGSPDVGPLAVFKTVRASLNSKSAPKDRNTDGFQTVWDSPFAGDCSRNADPRPFVWVKTADQILKSIER